MNLQFFTDAVQILADALPCQQQDKRVRALFEFFGEKPIERVKKAAMIAAHDLDRFPTPKMFSEIYASLDGEFQEAGRHECLNCDGFGWVFVEGKTYRGDCIHGERLSKLIPTANKPPARTMTDEAILGEITKNPVRFARGFMETSKSMKMGAPELYKRIRGLLVDLMGVDRLKTIYEEHQKDLKAKEEFKRLGGQK